MDNENIYDAVYKEENLNQKNENNSYNSERIRKPRKKGGGMGKIIALVVSCSLLGGVAGSGLTYVMMNNEVDTTQQNTVSNVNTADVSFKNDSTLSITEAFEKVAPAVVTVSTKGVTSNGFFQQQYEGVGSGFIINEDGYILTNYHVIEGASEISVTLSDNTTVAAKVVNYDENQDVAMLKITDSDVKIPAVVELGDSDQLRQGESVIAIGTPLSTNLSQTVTNGIVSALNRNVETESGVMQNLIQTDASINPGNSGGPLVNTRGQVVGINTMKATGTDTEGIGFAIPINDISDKIESLSKPILNLGISIRTVDETLANKLSMEQGLYVVEVNEFSPAEKAGVKPGDLIVKVDGQRVKTFDELKEIKNSKNDGDTITLEVIRDGKTKTLNVTLTSE
ncbi:trypsin-like peptidase domain-containing protein [Clostridium sp. NSJ-145]|uniref:S1C family serine protease n=1 Tax=Clostridium sp. NSJ-145 TaxID=2897777 RepID=UPI001E5BAFCC|nr:trypsin-like peptidase domain-containing protein [Clostridium sp. NSJ-145]MCD2501459.1 trypsin-like peptidase domain-containing protein [Clostridium sp. NSJ-145]